MQNPHDFLLRSVVLRILFGRDKLSQGYCEQGKHVSRLSVKQRTLFVLPRGESLYILVSVSGRNKENQFTVDISTTTRNQIEPAGHSSSLYLSCQYVRVLHIYMIRLNVVIFINFNKYVGCSFLVTHRKIPGRQSLRLKNNLILNNP